MPLKVQSELVTALNEGFYQCFAENQYSKAVSDVSYLHKAIISLFLALPERIYTEDEGNGNLYIAHIKQNDDQDGKLCKCVKYNNYLDVYAGGSYSVVNTNPTGVFSVAPQLVYQTPTP
ncbi:hypothetical protein CAPTEDRAFT_201787 [Capitella teleta]|uniref:Uncharacterized protein n=1 Tax=Capitella teleta TaxID=283909 RepID=R7UBA4_CAPTE|nr:hypothetical protein CAPTEDRAFT_201787 [Capitella teleta]|eukprot:ELU01078.1 hypothetical protein CAPTEDRAFT_201787 [Capitella teleta]